MKFKLKSHLIGITLLLLFALNLFAQDNNSHLVSLNACSELFKTESKLVSEHVLKKGLMRDDRILFEYMYAMNSYADGHFIFRDEAPGLAQKLNTLTKHKSVIDFGSGKSAAAQAIVMDQSVFLSQMARNLERLEALNYSYAYSFYNKLLNGETNFDELPAAFTEMFQFISKPESEKPNVLAINFEPGVPNRRSAKLEIWNDRLFESIQASDLPEYSVGISYFGVPSYTKQMSDFFRKALSKLEVGGILYIKGVRAKVAYPKDLAKVINLNQKLIERKSSSPDKQSTKYYGKSIYQWLKETGVGIKVLRSAGYEDSDFCIIKTQDKVYIPKTDWVMDLGSHKTPPVYLFVSY